MACTCYTHGGNCPDCNDKWHALIASLESDLATAIKERDAAVAAGRVLATCHFWRSEGAVAFLTSDQKMAWVNMKINEADDAVQANPLALAWVKAAQEASNVHRSNI